MPSAGASVCDLLKGIKKRGANALVHFTIFSDIPKCDVYEGNSPKFSFSFKNSEVKVSTLTSMSTKRSSEIFMSRCINKHAGADAYLL